MEINNGASFSTLAPIVHPWPEGKLVPSDSDHAKDLEPSLHMVVNSYTFENPCLVRKKEEARNKPRRYVLTGAQRVAINARLSLPYNGIEESLLPIKKRKRFLLAYEYDDFVPQKTMVNDDDGDDDDLAPEKSMVIDDDDDDDFVPEKKKRRNCGNNLKKSKKVSDEDEYGDGPIPAPGMPEAVKNRISELVGENREISREKLVVQKKLEKSDICSVQNRFSIPRRKLKARYLAKHEEGKEKKSVNIIDPSLNHHTVDLSYWNKSFHALNSSGWKEIREANNLRCRMIMQLWAVRVDNELWLALVDITPPALKARLE